MPYEKIARALLEKDGADPFEVDFGDLTTTTLVRTELERLGCTVEAVGVSTKLRVTPPSPPLEPS